jgi:hypothetical protein
LDGRWIWFGVPPGASFSGLAGTATTSNVTRPAPFSSTEAWYQLFVLQETSANVSQLSYAEFDELTQISIDLFTEILGTEHPDLTSFKASGGKILTWHGLSDQLLSHEGTIKYRQSLETNMGSVEVVNEFNRVFLAPGVAHCRGGNGPLPVEPLSVLADWVETGIVPETLFASITTNGTRITRNLCLYPKRLAYDGHGDVKSAASFDCK